jgi:hypothetical protein
MWVYYTVLLLLILIVGIKGAEFIVDVLRNRRDAVRKEDWMVSVMTAFDDRRRARYKP